MSKCNTRTKVFISGKLTTDENIALKREVALFHEAQRKLMPHYDEVCIPLNIRHLARPWIWSICYCIWHLWFDGYTHLVLLPTWEDSIGSQIERLVAIKRGLIIVHYDELIKILTDETPEELAALMRVCFER